MPKSKKSKTNNLLTYIDKIKKDMDSELQFTSPAKEALNTILCLLGTKISRMAVNMLVNVRSNRKKMTDFNIKNSVLNFVPSPLNKECDNFASKAVIRYNSSSKPKDNRSVPASEKAGIIMAPSKVQNIFINKELKCYSGYQKSASTSVYLAAVLEFITRKILRKTIEKIEKNKHSVMLKYIAMAVSKPLYDEDGHPSPRGGDEILYSLMKKLNVCFAQSPVEVTKPVGTKNEKKDVVYYQRQGECLHFRQAPFDEISRHFAKEQSPTGGAFRFDPEAIVTLQYFVEDCLHQKLLKTREITHHSGRSRSSRSDMELAVNLEK